MALENLPSNDSYTEAGYNRNNSLGGNSPAAQQKFPGKGVPVGN